MDDLIELILELLFDIGEEATKSKKTPKWIKRILVGIFVIIFAGINLLLLIVGFTSLKTDFLIGTFFIALSVFFIIGSYFKINKSKKKLLTKK